LNEEVTHLPQSELRRPRRRRRRAGGRRSTTGRMIRGALLAKTALVCIVLIAAGILYLRIGLAPLRFEGLTQQVTAALAQRLGDDWQITLDDSAVTLVDGAIGMKVRGLDIRNAEGVLVARAPSALVSVATWSVLSGAPLPRAIELHDVQLRVRIARDGSLSLAPDTAAVLVPATSEPADIPQTITFAPPPSLPFVLGSFLEMLLDPSNPVGAIDYARIVDASLTLIDDEGRERVGFSDVDALFRTTPDGRSFEAEFEGESGRWRLAGEASRSSDGGRDAALRIDDVPVNDVILFSGAPSIIGSGTLRLSGSLDFGIDAENGIRRLDARLSSSAGRLAINDPEFSSLRVDDVTAEAFWDPDVERLEIRRLDYRSGVSDIRLRGEAVAASEAGGWRLALSGSEAVLSGATARDRPSSIESISLRAHGGPDGFFLEELSLRGDDADVALALSYGAADDQGGIRVGLEVHDTSVRTALRLWPLFVAPKPRTFLANTLLSGNLDRLSLSTVITGEGFSALRQKRGLHRDALAIAFEITDATLLVNENLPPLERLAVMGAVDGTSASVSGTGGDLVMADGRSLSFSEGVFALADLWDRAEPASLDFRLNGPADALGSFLTSNPVARRAAANIDPDTIEGRVDLTVSMPLLFSDLPKIEDMPIMISGSLNDLSLGAMLGREALSGGAFLVDYKDGDLMISGDALLSDDRASIEVRQQRGEVGEALISLVLDDAARRRRGIMTGQKIAGPIPLTIRIGLGEDRAEGTRVEADLTGATIDGLVPGWIKPSGQTGALSFRVVEGETISIEDFALDAGAFRARGRLRMSPEGELLEARIDDLRLSPGDDASVTVERAGSLWKVGVRGNVIDARPFLDRISSGADIGGRGDLDIDLDLRTDILAGHHDEALTNARLNVSIRGQDLRQLDLRGRFPGAELAARTGIMPDGSPIILVESEDAGATLRFADLYTRMVGGTLTFQLGTEGERRPGILLVREFMLRDEPALRRVVAQQTGNVGRDGQPIDFAAARFTQARADFVREAGRIDLEEAVMWGVEVGFKLEGFVDYALDYVDLNGTFVPAYGLNNAFAQVPLFGAILGGNRNEGLFGVNFRVSGPASGPNLTINPLSAIAPGFLRQLFGASRTPYRSPADSSSPKLAPIPPLSIAPPSRQGSGIGRD